MQQGCDRRRSGRAAFCEHAKRGRDAVGGEEEVFVGAFLGEDGIEIEGEAVDAFFEVCGDGGLWR